MDFSVVVPTRDRPLALRKLLGALAAQQYSRERFEAIVVDDGSMPPLAGLEREFRGALDLRILRLAGSGCGPARQAGADCALGKYLAFTDDDCQPETDWLARLAVALQRHPGAAVGGRMLNALGRNLFSETTQFIVGLLTVYGHGEDGQISYCPTSNAAFPAVAFRRLGGMDRSWSNSGGEDRDLCARWIADGHKLYYEPRALVRHYHPLSAAAFARQHFSYGRGAWQFHRCFPGRFERPGFYRQLLTGAFEEYAARRAVNVALHVGLAQAAEAAGFLFEAGFGGRWGRR